MKQNSDINIKVFSEKYIKEVADIHTQSPDGWSKKNLENDIKNESTKSYVALLDEQVVGFCSFLVTDDAEMIFVCTDLSHRNKGIAFEMLKTVMPLLQVEHIVLEVRSKNAGAQRLYEKLDFKTIGKRKNFYSNPSDDALVMEKYYIVQ